MASNADRTLPAGSLGTLLLFLRSEAAGGVVLIVSAIVAMIWANVDYHSYHAAIETPWLANIKILDAHHAVNDGLMAVFFLLVGLEIRREMMDGELSSLTRIAAPAFAAIGGTVVPALLFVALNYGDRLAMRGWAIPMATDIAFSLAVLQVVGSRVPAGLKIFLTALAIIDDIAAIGVIAIFYSDAINVLAAGGAVVSIAVLFGLTRAGVRTLWPYLLGGAVLWAFVAGSGVHATLAGVVLAFLVPMRARGDEVQSPGIRLEHALTGVVAWVVLPLFGLTNAGLPLNDLPAGAFASPVFLGIAAGLFIGKQAGIYGVTRIAAALGVARLPEGLTWRQVYGVAILCGIGFTMSLFVAELAFYGYPVHGEAKLAVFVGSLLSALVGLAVLASAPATRDDAGTAAPEMRPG